MNDIYIYIYSMYVYIYIEIYTCHQQISTDFQAGISSRGKSSGPRGATGATGATGRAIWRLPCNGAHQAILGSKNGWWCLVMYLCGGPKWPVSLWDLQIYMFYIIYVYIYIYIYIMYYISNNRGVIRVDLRIKARGMIMRSQAQPWPRTIGWLRAAMVHMCQRD